MDRITFTLALLGACAADDRLGRRLAREPFACRRRLHRDPQRRRATTRGASRHFRVVAADALDRSAYRFTVNKNSPLLSSLTRITPSAPDAWTP